MLAGGGGLVSSTIGECRGAARACSASCGTELDDRRARGHPGIRPVVAVDTVSRGGGQRGAFRVDLYSRIKVLMHRAPPLASEAAQDSAAGQPLFLARYAAGIGAVRSMRRGHGRPAALPWPGTSRAGALHRERVVPVPRRVVLPRTCPAPSAASRAAGRRGALPIRAASPWWGRESTSCAFLVLRPAAPHPGGRHPRHRSQPLARKLSVRITPMPRRPSSMLPSVVPVGPGTARAALLAAVGGARVRISRPPEPNPLGQARYSRPVAPGNRPGAPVEPRVNPRSCAVQAKARSGVWPGCGQLDLDVADRHPCPPESCSRGSSTAVHLAHPIASRLVTALARGAPIRRHPSISARRSFPPTWSFW